MGMWRSYVTFDKIFVKATARGAGGARPKVNYTPRLRKFLLWNNLKNTRFENLKKNRKSKNKIERFEKDFFHEWEGLYNK